MEEGIRRFQQQQDTPTDWKIHGNVGVDEMQRKIKALAQFRCLRFIRLEVQEMRAEAAAAFTEALRPGQALHGLAVLRIDDLDDAKAAAIQADLAAWAGSPTAGGEAKELELANERLSQEIRMVLGREWHISADSVDQSKVSTLAQNPCLDRIVLIFPMRAESAAAFTEALQPGQALHGLSNLELWPLDDATAAAIQAEPAAWARSPAAGGKAKTLLLRWPRLSEETKAALREAIP